MNQKIREKNDVSGIKFLFSEQVPDNNVTELVKEFWLNEVKKVYVWQTQRRVDIDFREERNMIRLDKIREIEKALPFKLETIEAVSGNLRLTFIFE